MKHLYLIDLKEYREYHLITLNIRFPGGKLVLHFQTENS